MMYIFLNNIYAHEIWEGNKEQWKKYLSAVFIVGTSEAIRSYMSYNVWQGVSTFKALTSFFTLLQVMLRASYLALQASSPFSIHFQIIPQKENETIEKIFT